MSYFIVGDVHGCYYTLRKLLKHWNPKEEQLIFVGDYINKGKHSKEVVHYIRKIQSRYPNTICLKGNHEYEMCEYIDNHVPYTKMKEAFKETLKGYDLRKKYKSDLNWMRKLPLTFENNVLFVSHAGVNFLNLRKYNEQSRWSVLRYRGKLKKMKKLQVFGHTPTGSGKVEYLKQVNCLNIDTGAGNYDYLSAAVISRKGKIEDVIKEKVDKSDKES